MFPNKCSVAVADRRCANPPSKVVSIVSDDGQYMVGVSCEQHSEVFMARVKKLQEDGKLESGSIRLEPLNAVGTDCIRGDADDLITPDTGKQAPHDR